MGMFHCHSHFRCRCWHCRCRCQQRWSEFVCLSCVRDACQQFSGFELNMTTTITGCSWSRLGHYQPNSGKMLDRPQHFNGRSASHTRMYAIRIKQATRLNIKPAFGTSVFVCEPSKNCIVLFVLIDVGLVGGVVLGLMVPKPDMIKAPRPWLAAVSRGIVLEPMTRLAEGPSEMGVPDIVTPGPPGERVLLAMMKPVGAAVKG